MEWMLAKLWCTLMWVEEGGREGQLAWGVGVHFALNQLTPSVSSGATLLLTNYNSLRLAMLLVHVWEKENYGHDFIIYIRVS